jgi:hypothetical protein
MLALAGLASRSLGGTLDAYCNATNFAFFGHWLKDNVDYFSTTLRRAAGHARVGPFRFDETVITRPEHAAQNAVPVDVALLTALAQARRGLPTARASALWDSMLLFNNANTDDTWFPQELELIAMVGAMQRLLDAASKANDFAKKLETLLVPDSPVPIDSCARTSASGGARRASSVRAAWAREIYRLRGSPAHGNIESRQPRSWDDFHHLALARFVFPLVVKARLTEWGFYTLTADDRDRIQAFEVWACDPKPFAEPEGAKRVDREILARFMERLERDGDRDTDAQSDEASSGRT